MTNLQLLEIVIWAMIAGFLILNLRRVLGRRTGNEKPPAPFAPQPPPADDNVIALPSSGRKPEMEEEAQDVEQTPVMRGLAEIGRLDPAFSEAEFLAGAKEAFEIILHAFAAGDEMALRSLLSKEVFANFRTAIEDRANAGETMETELIGFKKATIADAELQGTTAHITVDFVSEQVNAIKDKDGKVIDGDPTRIITVTDTWMFARNTRSSNPNWELVGTESPDEA